MAKEEMSATPKLKALRHALNGSSLCHVLPQTLSRRDTCDLHEKLYMSIPFPQRYT